MEASIKKIIKLALQHLGLDSEDAREMLYVTGKAESVSYTHLTLPTNREV